MLLTRRASPSGQDHDWTAVRSALVRYIRGRTGRLDLAEDVAQETLARLIALQEQDTVGSLFALGFRIADNLVIDIHRREARASGEVDERFECTAPSLDRVVDSRHAVAILSRTLQRMPPLRREVILRRRLRRQSCAVIAEELELTPKAVEKHITRGLVDLKTAFDKAGLAPESLGE
ncbi:RNA polymerase sigma factor [Sphingomonas sp. HF-S4]|uniref:RNA polymerase sigma factor n=1 Tax=Sphingomonas agrestis TaxID=3080540 RepID=A0ABU3Y3U4_9SPHN|nr:RNA polymerase sigma factor [Sphingomonas sp. HF-S4]MDV3456064.1 RNA polymerase sigma factor [Sphingomonas sp. HF-S4]